MVDCKEPEVPPVEKRNTDEVKKELNEMLENWWIRKHNSNEKMFKEWSQQVEEGTIPKRTARPFKKKVQWEKSPVHSNFHQISAVNPTLPPTADAVGHTLEAIQKAAETLTALNSSQPTVGLLPTPPTYNMVPYQQPYSQNQGNWGQNMPWAYNGSGPNPYNAGRSPFNRNYGGRGQPANSNQMNWRGNEELQYCTYCKKNIGHTRQFCRKRMKEEFEAQRKLLENGEGNQLIKRGNFVNNGNGQSNNDNGNNNKENLNPERRYSPTNHHKTAEGGKGPEGTRVPTERREGNSPNNFKRFNQSKNGERRPPPQR
jgi:hypothetical protein